MFYLLMMAALICFISFLYLIASGSLVAGIALFVLAILIIVYIFTHYSHKKIENCVDGARVCGDIMDCIK